FRSPPSWSDRRLACRLGGQARRLSLHRDSRVGHRRPRLCSLKLSREPQAPSTPLPLCYHTHMPLQPDEMLGPYKISGLLGEGGMGVVYRARDTRLHRDVAIKVLTAITLDDQERLARFEQEARATGMLNH